MTIISNFYNLFLGSSPDWYKKTIISFLFLNPVLLYLLNTVGADGKFIVGWILLLEFIFTLALALKCYPLQPGGLLAIEAILMGLTKPDSIYYEVEHNLQVILLLVFMVAGIYFMKNLMMVTFTKLLLKVHSKTKLSLLFCFVAAFLSAFLDALTVTAVLIAVIIGFYRVYHLAMSNLGFDTTDHNINDDSSLSEKGINELENFKSTEEGQLEK
jgi:NhaB family Na+:H+ antiporter